MLVAWILDGEREKGNVCVCVRVCVNLPCVECVIGQREGKKIRTPEQLPPLNILMWKMFLIYFNLSQVGIDTECISFVLEQWKDTSAHCDSALKHNKRNLGVLQKRFETASFG